MLNLHKTKCTLFCHFYNEEWLLPHWIRHHVNLFDDCIMINYASTDSSVDIIRELAPHWKIVDSGNKQFDAELCDTEIMKMEEDVQGWKMVLNVTEFLIVDDLKTVLRKIENTKLDMVRFKGYQINDTKEEMRSGFDNTKSIVLQRYHGQADPWRDRIIHKQRNGSYYIGRHYNTPGLKINSYSKIQHKNIPIYEGLYLFWYRFAPFKEQLPRKIQISSRIPQSDIDKGFGWNHWELNEKKLYERWQQEEAKNTNLLEIPEVGKAYENIRHSLVW